MTPLPGLKLETSGFGFMHQPDEPKSLSHLEEVGNPHILHNTNIYWSKLGHIIFMLTKKRVFPHKKHQTCKTGSEATVLFAWPFFIKCDSSAITIWMKSFRRGYR
jgi:hypothetical protein